MGVRIVEYKEEDRSVCRSSGAQKCGTVSAVPEGVVTIKRLPDLLSGRNTPNFCSEG